MDTTLQSPISVSRPALVRVQDALVKTWQRWQAARRQAAEFEALQRLSPSVLQDIGALPEWQNAARHWREQRAAERDAVLRGLA
jgi:uncharacterized protein YjiS (DUF1127 family)